MSTITVLNTKAIQGVFVAADEATVAAREATEAAALATRQALEAAGNVASIDALMPRILAILRAELGSRIYNPRGEWSGTAVYKANDLVSFILPDGSAGAFIAVTNVPVGALPTDTAYWTPLVDSAPPPRLSVTLNLPTEALTLAPGATADVQVQLERFNLSPLIEVTFEVSSDEPGLSGVIVAAPADETATDEEADELNPNEEGDLEEAGKKSFHILRLKASEATPEGTYTLTVTAKVAGWVDDPSSPLYTLIDRDPLTVVAARPGAEGAATAVYGMSALGGYTLAEFTRDSGPNALHLIRKGDVRPNSRGDAWRGDGTPGSVLHTPPLTNHAMNAAQELLFIVPDPEGLADGAVVAALASTTRKHDYVCVYKASTGFVLRTAAQNAAGTGADTRDSGAVPLDTRLAISADPVSKLVTLYAVRENRGSSVPLPAWTAAGVVASFFAVLQADGAVLLPSVGQVVAAEPRRSVMTATARVTAAQRLVDSYSKRTAADAAKEFPTGTRLILTMKKGEAVRDRTLYDPATHDLILLGDAAEGPNGGIVTTGAAGSGARTNWLPDVSWERDFTMAFLADEFFADPIGLSYLALASQASPDVTAWVKIRPAPVVVNGVTRFDARFSVISTATVFGTLQDVGNRPRLLFRLRYDAAKREVTVSEVFSGRTIASPIAVPANFTGPLGLSFGTAYKGSAAGGAEVGATEASASRHGGAWVGTKLYSSQEEADALEALGVTATALTPTGTGTGSVPLSSSSLVGVQDFSEASLSSDLKTVFDTYAKPGFLYMSNEKRNDKVGVHVPWDPAYASRYVIKTHNGESYRSYTGPACGQYFQGRGIASFGYSVVNGSFRALKDLRVLDVACFDLEALVDGAKDMSGIESNQPDGFLGFTYGCDPQLRLYFAPGDSRNTAAVRDLGSGPKIYYSNEDNGNEGLSKLTGVEKQLEEGLMLAFMVIALGAHQNMDKFSPTYESARTGTPAYYRRVRDKARKLYRDTCTKWDRKWGTSRESELPMHVRRSLIHSYLNELAAKVADTKIEHGSAWKSSADYAECQRAWKLAFGETEKVGVAKTNLANWHEATHPKYGRCVYWAHDLKRMKPSSTKDATGEYVTRDLGGNGPHPNNYTAHDYGAMVFMHEEGCDFVTRDWLSKVANTMLATLQLGDIFDNNGSVSGVPYGMHGGNQVPSLVSPWGQSKSLKGATKGLLTYGGPACMAAYDTHGELEGLVKKAYSRFGGVQTHGATAGLLLAAAKREGKL